MVDALQLTPRILFVGCDPVFVAAAQAHLDSLELSYAASEVATHTEMRAAMLWQTPALILGAMNFTPAEAMTPLSVGRELAPDAAFIAVLPVVNEEGAADALLSGADDSLFADQIWMLAPVLARAVARGSRRDEMLMQRTQIVRLRRGLRMLRGINELALRIKDRGALLKETCQLAVELGGYGIAIAYSKMPEMLALQPIAWSGIDPRTTERLRNYIAESSVRRNSVVGEVLGTGRPLVCNDTSAFEGTGTFDNLLIHAGFKSVVVLPLLSSGTAVGVLVLAAGEQGALSAEELNVLQEMAATVSSAIEHMQRDVKVRFLSNFDPQTGLAKRSLLCDRLQRAITTASTTTRRIAVVVLDVERLSLINDSFGRRSGDNLILQIAERLKSYVGDTGRLAHFGGGSFALIADQGERTQDEMLLAADRLTSTLFDPLFNVEGTAMPVAVRSGYCVYPDDGDNASTLVQKAEAALRTARAFDKRHLRFDATAVLLQVDQLSVAHRLRGALARGEFDVYYQPKVNVITRRMEGAEALLRWHDGERGLIAAQQFMPLLESTGLIEDVGAWVLERAAHDCQSWMRAGLPPVRVAVNIAPVQLRNEEFAALFTNVAAGWSTRRCGLDIEITEGVFQLESPACIRKLNALRAKGCRIALDDFGTGYSSLARMASLPIDILKIDKSFIDQLSAGVSARALVQTVIDLGRTFGLTTVAEGVETQTQLDELWKMGCDQSQGYLHSKAVSPREFEDLLAFGSAGRLYPPEMADPILPASVTQAS